MGAHSGIDPGPLAQESGALTNRLEVRSCSAQNNCTFWTHNLSTSHIRIPIKGINLEILYIA